MLKKFGTWPEDQTGIGKRMPYLAVDDEKSLLTTSECQDQARHGTIVSKTAGNQPAKWIAGDAENPGMIWYWIKESSTMLQGWSTYTYRSKTLRTCKRVERSKQM